MADADGDMQTIGKFGRRKHEKMSGDCRASATMSRTGTAGGSNGPTVGEESEWFHRSVYC